ncbi:class I tRNA ligase family protein [Rahnella sikkimica]|uniref:class I tRNA ligase family protein n=1 Tax=Rahnella sikkimica TaxID=1805933 RepID=UPI001CFF8173|nr:class I tRNA ligase family protein [Rahnella sikkimica]
MSKTLIIAPPPTPNGDLHVGHMAGPYLAEDIYSRYLRSTGVEVNYATGTDDSQTYVVTSGFKLGVTPEELCCKAAQDIEHSLEAWEVNLDGYAPFDDGYKKMVYEFLTPLYEQGKFKLKKVKLPYSSHRNEFMVESFVTGECPSCPAQSRGGLCDSCGQPNNFDLLRNPTATLPPFESLEYKEVSILVFPVESYLDGREYLIEAYSWDGVTILGSIVERVTLEGNSFDDDVHHAPTDLSGRDLQRVHAAVHAVAVAQGLTRSVMHAEIRFHQGLPYIVEIAARPGCGGLDFMARISANYCPIKAVIDVAIGNKPASAHTIRQRVSIPSHCV